MEHNACVDEYHRNDELNEQPDNYVDSLRSLE